MHLLYTNILPIGICEGQKTIIDWFNEEIGKADQVKIASGYTSVASLEELERLVSMYNISSAKLIIGMYGIEGMPERAYHIAMRINRSWKEKRIGEIRLVKSFKYHGKVFCFYKNGNPISAMIGSANLGAIKLEATNRRQYEIAMVTESTDELIDINEHLEKLEMDSVSQNIGDVLDISLVREVNTSLDNTELVTSVPQSNVKFYDQQSTEVLFRLPLKVPKEEERFMDNGKHFTKSNINVCYAAPRNKRKARDWFETQITVGANIYKMEGYPQKNHPFFVITDDGYWFKAHTTSDNNKQFSAVGDELIMGKWLKGRLVAAGIVKAVNDTSLDTERKGMITKEMLEQYGSDQLVFKKTGQTALDEAGNRLDVWMISFVRMKED